MVSTFVSMMLMLSPMNNGHHNGWEHNGKFSRPTPAFQPVAPAHPASPGSTPPISPSGGGSSGPGANQYTD